MDPESRYDTERRKWDAHAHATLPSLDDLPVIPEGTTLAELRPRQDPPRRHGPVPRRYRRPRGDRVRLRPRRADRRPRPERGPGDGGRPVARIGRVQPEARRAAGPLRPDPLRRRRGRDAAVPRRVVRRRGRQGRPPSSRAGCRRRRARPDPPARWPGRLLRAAGDEPPARVRPRAPALSGQARPGSGSAADRRDVRAWRAPFASLQIRPVQLFSMVERAFGFRTKLRPLRALDRALLRRWPRLGRFCRYGIMLFEKAPADPRSGRLEAVERGAGAAEEVAPEQTALEPAQAAGALQTSDS